MKNKFKYHSAIGKLQNTTIFHFSFLLLHYFNGLPQLRVTLFSVSSDLGVMGLAMHI